MTVPLNYLENLNCAIVPDSLSLLLNYIASNSISLLIQCFDIGLCTGMSQIVEGIRPSHTINTNVVQQHHKSIIFGHQKTNTYVTFELQTHHDSHLEGAFIGFFRCFFSCNPSQWQNTGDHYCLFSAFHKAKYSLDREEFIRLLNFT